MVSYKKMLLIFAAIIAFLFAVPLIFTLFDDNIAHWIVPNKAKGIKTEWISFWGNMIGSLIQGVATAAGIIVTYFIFKEDKEREKAQKQEEATNIFIKEFGKKLSAYDMLIPLVSNYDNLNDYYEAENFDKLEQLTHEINDGEITARVSLMQREIYGYKRDREQGLFYDDEDTSYSDADGKIRTNMKHLQNFLTKKRKQQIYKYKDLTGFDLSEEAIWDKGRTFSLRGVATVRSSATANLTVTRANGEVE